jgi:hypothetical protein
MFAGEGGRRRIPEMHDLHQQADRVSGQAIERDGRGVRQG